MLRKPCIKCRAVLGPPQNHSQTAEHLRQCSSGKQELNEDVFSVSLFLGSRSRENFRSWHQQSARSIGNIQQ